MALASPRFPKAFAAMSLDHDQHAGHKSPLSAAEPPSADSRDVRFLTALPVFNEARHVNQVLDEVAKYATDVLVVDDGSTDDLQEILAQRDDVFVVRHATNLGYGAALRTAFDFAIVHRYDVVVTIDCDGQHEPQRIGALVAACENADMVSGSRYLAQKGSAESAPMDRRRINQQITAELNCRLGLSITDAFCGFKAYRVQALARLQLTESGYAMPLELWVQAAVQGLRIIERPVPLIYLDEERSFGDDLDDSETRLRYYHRVIDAALGRVAKASNNAGKAVGRPADPADCPLAHMPLSCV